MIENKEEYGPLLLRLGLGALLLLPGLDKLMGMLSEGHMIAEMLGVPGAWALLLVEIVFGLAVLVGWKVKYTTLPLIGVMIGATVMTVIPALGEEPMAMIDLLFHLSAITGLAGLSLLGPGAYSVEG